MEEVIESTANRPAYSGFSNHERRLYVDHFARVVYRPWGVFGRGYFVDKERVRKLMNQDQNPWWAALLSGLAPSFWSTVPDAWHPLLLVSFVGLVLGIHSVVTRRQVRGLEAEPRLSWMDDARRVAPAIVQWNLVLVTCLLLAVVTGSTWMAFSSSPPAIFAVIAFLLLPVALLQAYFLYLQTRPDVAPPNQANDVISSYLEVPAKSSVVYPSKWPSLIPWFVGAIILLALLVGLTMTAGGLIAAIAILVLIFSGKMILDMTRDGSRDHQS